MLDSSVASGRRCTLARALVTSSGDVRIGDDVFISREVVIADGSSAVPLRLGPIHPVPALGAGAAVTSDIAPRTVEAGDAAQVVRTRPWRA